MDARKLMKYITEWDEGPKLDFKQKFIYGYKIIKVIAAIANSTGGKGRIIFGVDNAKNILGVDPDESKEYEETIHRSIEDRINPYLETQFDIVKCGNDKTLAALTIFKNQKTLYQIRPEGSFPIRRGSTTSTMRTDEIVSKLQMYGKYDYEMLPVVHATSEDLDHNLVKRYIIMVETEITKPSERTLERFGLICKPNGNQIYRPTNWAMLLFGKDPQRFLPHTYVRVFEGNVRKDFLGNIPKQLTDLSMYFRAKLPKDYPHNGLYRALENALVHRDYTDKMGINIKVKKNGITIINPGVPLDKNCEYSVKKDTLQIRRNPKLYYELNEFMKGSPASHERSGIIEIMKAFNSTKFLNLGQYKYNNNRVFQTTLTRDTV